jgi:hypothetical protein
MNISLFQRTTMIFMCVCLRASRQRTKGNSSTITHAMRDQRRYQPLITHSYGVKGRKKTRSRSYSILYQNRTEHTPSRRGVQKRKAGRACARLVIEKDDDIADDEEKTLYFDIG